MKEYKFLVRVYFKNGTKEQRTWIETTIDAKEKAKKCREDANVTKVTLYRIDQHSIFKERKRIDKMIKSYILSRDGNKQLTKHFKVKEFACKDGSPVVFIDEYLYEILEILRNKLGKPVIITSGYRTPE